MGYIVCVSRLLLWFKLRERESRGQWRREGEKREGEKRGGDDREEEMTERGRREEFSSRGKRMEWKESQRTVKREKGQREDGKQIDISTGQTETWNTCSIELNPQ